LRVATFLFYRRNFSERPNYAPLPTGQQRPVGRNGSRVVVRARLARRL